jgi:gluconolactonase
MKKISLITPLVAAALLFSGCQSKNETEVAASFGTIERLDEALNSIIDEDAVIEVIAEEHVWTEGPLWIPQHNMLLFSDIPPNKIYKWTEEKGVEEYLTPSGYTGSVPSTSPEQGSNGLILRSDNKLVLCQHGDRRVSVMDAPLDQPAASFIPIVHEYEGRKLNSPNDATFASDGDLFFTDPPYGLPGNVDDPTKEIPFQGVYHVSSDGVVTLLTDSLTRPNGIALTPDEKTLVVANSDSDKAIWYAFDVTPDDSLTNARVFYDATPAAKTERGLPDGLKFDGNGNLFATGPGGVWIFDPSGKLLGKIKVDDPTSNCAFSEDDKTLFITNDDRVLRVRLRK